LIRCAGAVDVGSWKLGFVWRRAAKKGGEDLLAAVVEKQCCNLRKLGGKRAGAVRFGRFLHNRNVTKEEMLEAAAEAVGQRAKGRHLLVIQDTSELNFSGHKISKRGFGTVGNGEDIGIFLHPQLVIDALTGGVIGLAGAEIINRDTKPDVHRRRRKIEDKASMRWLTGAQKASTVLAEAAEITVVADRESDIYEDFARRPANVHLLTRLAQDRCLAGGGKLFAFAASLEERLRYEIDVPAKGPRKARKAIVRLSFGRVSVARPRNAVDKTLPESLELSIVDVREIDPPAEAEPVHWLLSTTHPIETVEAARRIVTLYRRRWHIEQLFRTLKSQCLQLEDSQIEEETTLSKLAAVALIAAVRVMQLVQARDGSTHQLLDDAFEPADEPLIEALVVKLEGKTEKQKNPHAKGTLARAAWVIGRLGGWDGYVGHGYKPAGPKTMYDGLRRFDGIRLGWNVAQDV
jgi:Transposase DDE domain